MRFCLFVTLETVSESNVTTYNFSDEEALMRTNVLETKLEKNRESLEIANANDCATNDENVCFLKVFFLCVFVLGLFFKLDFDFLSLFGFLFFLIEKQTICYVC